MSDYHDDWNSRAQAHLHWFNTSRTAWLHHDQSDMWTGWHADTAAAVEVVTQWQPWSTVCDDSEAPYVRWFSSALTNAAFNELDRHVLQVRSPPRLTGTDGAQINVVFSCSC